MENNAKTYAKYIANCRYGLGNLILSCSSSYRMEEKAGIGNKFVK